MNPAITVLSHGYQLIPFAHRLRTEGEDAQVQIYGTDPHLLWEGGAGWALGTGPEQIHLAGGPSYPVLPSTEPPTSHLRLGFWFDGERALALHALVVDVGLWPGGLGPRHPGGLTLVRLDNETPVIGALQSLLDVPLETLRTQGFRGLAHVGLSLATDTGTLGLSGLSAGWPYLQTHAFLGELENFGDVLRGKPPELPKKFVTVVPMSLPPYPFVSRDHSLPPPRPIIGPSPAQLGRVFWHDVQIRDADEGRQLWTSTTFGLVGVARGAAGTSELARALALEIPPRLGFADLQWRADVGAGVQAALAQVEALFGVVL